MGLFVLARAARWTLYLATHAFLRLMGYIIFRRRSHILGLQRNGGKNLRTLPVGRQIAVVVCRKLRFGRLFSLQNSSVFGFWHFQFSIFGVSFHRRHSEMSRASRAVVLGSALSLRRQNGTAVLFINFSPVFFIPPKKRQYFSVWMVFYRRRNAFNRSTKSSWTTNRTLPNVLGRWRRWPLRPTHSSRISTCYVPWKVITIWNSNSMEMHETFGIINCRPREGEIFQAQSKQIRRLAACEGTDFLTAPF